MVASREWLLNQLRRTKPRWLHTHPTLSERLAAIADFPDSVPTVEREPAIELLSDHQVVEAKLTSVLTGYVHDTISRMNDLHSDFAGAED